MQLLYGTYSKNQVELPRNNKGALTLEASSPLWYMQFTFVAKKIRNVPVNQGKLTSVNGKNWSEAKKAVKKEFPHHYLLARKNFLNKTYDFFLLESVLHGREEKKIDLTVLEDLEQDPDFAGFSFTIVKEAMAKLMTS